VAHASSQTPGALSSICWPDRPRRQALEMRRAIALEAQRESHAIVGDMSGLPRL
jgi:hypothetical protein